MKTYANPPTHCDLCKTPITTQFYDAFLGLGTCANVCPSCFYEYGIGLGTGRGQCYQHNASTNKYEKVEG